MDEQEKIKDGPFKGLTNNEVKSKKEKEDRVDVSHKGYDFTFNNIQKSDCKIGFYQCKRRISLMCPASINVDETNFPAVTKEVRDHTCHCKTMKNNGFKKSYVASTSLSYTQVSQSSSESSTQKSDNKEDLKPAEPDLKKSKKNDETNNDEGDYIGESHDLKVEALIQIAMSQPTFFSEEQEMAIERDLIVKSQDPTQHTQQENERASIDQATLTQLWKGVPYEPPSLGFFKAEKHFKDTDNKWYLHLSETDMLRLFKKGEFFTIHDTESVLQIESFEMIEEPGEGRRKCAVGILYSPITETYLGGVSKNNDNENQFVVPYVQHKEKKKIKLVVLRNLVSDFEVPKKPLIYDSLDPDLIKKKYRFDGHGIIMSYVHNKQDRKRLRLFEDAVTTLNAFFFIKTEVNETLKKEKEEIIECIKSLSVILLKGNKDHKILMQDTSQKETEAKGIFDRLESTLTKLKNTSKVSGKEIKEMIVVVRKCIMNLKKFVGAPKVILVLDVFQGIGGMAYGFTEEGLDVKFGVEINKSVSKMYMENHKRTKVFVEDVCVWFEKVKRSVETDEYNDYRNCLEVQHVQYSPPCTGYSSANRFGGKDDEKNCSYTLLCIEITKFFFKHGKMQSISFENVTGILDKDNIGYLSEVRDELTALGMNVHVFVLDASRYGDPQKRFRVFLIAHRQTLYLPCPIPDETHGEEGLKPLVTSSDALNCLIQYEPTAQDEAFTTNHEGKEVLVDNHVINKNISDGEPLFSDKPSHTVRCKANIWHYQDNPKRPITVREMALLQSLPLDFKLPGNKTQKVKGIGNAVPVQMARAIGKVIKMMYFGSYSV